MADPSQSAILERDKVSGSHPAPPVSSPPLRWWWHEQGCLAERDAFHRLRLDKRRGRNRPVLCAASISRGARALTSTITLRRTPITLT